MKRNFTAQYSEIVLSPDCTAWQDGMIGGNGETGFITSGSPYQDVFIFQHMYFNYPSPDPRVIPAWLPGQLEEARSNIFALKDDWQVWDPDEAHGRQLRKRTCFYAYHPGPQLRLGMEAQAYEKYMRYTELEIGEVGVQFTDCNGAWERRAFTSRTDNVTIIKIEKSSLQKKLQLTISLDDIATTCRTGKVFSDVDAMRYKKLADENGEWISFIGHYPVYEGSELFDGGYASCTRVLVEGEQASCRRVVCENTDVTGNVGENVYIQVQDADAVYLITALDRDFHLTGSDSSDSAEVILERFRKQEQYALLEHLKEQTQKVADKYQASGHFSYEKALEQSAKAHREEFLRVSFALEGDAEFQDWDNDALVQLQRVKTDTINHEFLRRVYDQARYAMICACKTSAPRLCGMWTGDWQSKWRAIYTLDANVNLQVSAMNTGNLRDMPLGYLTFFLRNVPDFMENAKMSYSMHDAIQVPVNADADRSIQVEYDSNYPFQYWNAGASWCLLPIFEYWQCYGNRQIPINPYMRFENLRPVLSVEDGGLSEEAFLAIKERGYLDLERDILLPLLTKQANFWEQMVTPRYYTDCNGNACFDLDKTSLQPGERYLLIPTYSPENHPIGYCSTLTANAVMDIAAARNGLEMLCTIEKTVKRPGYEASVTHWEGLMQLLPEYQYDTDGALKEWAMKEYEENNNHRHLSHLYVAWPAYETRRSKLLSDAANAAMNNRNTYNTDDATAGHGWMHKALVEARLRRGDGMVSSLLKMMNGIAFYPTFMTNHDSNRRWGTYCTDTLFGIAGAVNEALVFSDTGEIELLPALPSDWRSGQITGLMSRSRAQICELTWDLDAKKVAVEIQSLCEANQLHITCGLNWKMAAVNGCVYVREQTEEAITITLSAGECCKIEFAL